MSRNIHLIKNEMQNGLYQLQFQKVVSNGRQILTPKYEVHWFDIPPCGVI